MAYWDGTRWVDDGATAHPLSSGQRSFRRPAAAPLALSLSILLVLPAAAVVASASSVIEGTAYRDLNRDAVLQTDEPVLADQLIYLYDGTGKYLKNTWSDGHGRYAFTDLAVGAYRVEYSTSSWRELRSDWVPTTTGSIFPRVTVLLAGYAKVDFGWREIVRSRDLSAPMSTFVGPNGLRLESYNDVIPASELYDVAMAGSVGDEGQFVTIRFDYSDTTNTALSYQGSPGSYRSYKAICYVNWLGWLTAGDTGLSHEYGHAWSAYYDRIVHQDGSFSSYVRARGLEGDERLNSTYLWSVSELIAEDYRQLLGSPNARRAPQANRELPPASEVQGLAEFLLSYGTVAASEPAPSPSSSPSPSPSSSPSPSLSPTPSPAPSPSPSPAPSPSPSPTPSPVPEPVSTLDVEDPVIEPAPVVDSATLNSSITEPASVTIEIRNARGQLVRTLVSNMALNAGSIEVEWDRRDERGKRVKAGTYVAVVQAVASDGRQVRVQTSFQAA